MRVSVVGLGYVGLTSAAALAEAGHQTVGVDIDVQRVEAVNAGDCPLPTPEELHDVVAGVVAQGSLHATTDPEEARNAEAVLICVDTPVDPSTHRPENGALEAALGEVAPILQRDVLVSIESTLTPGTMSSLARPLLEEGSGLRVHEEFHLVHCPERVTTGSLLQNLRTLDRVVGGETAPSRARAISLYRSVCGGRLLEAGWVDAELSKTVENAYRDVQLAFANEVARVCESVGGDVLAVQELVNSCPGREMLQPGPGVGGHCLPKDTWLLLASRREDEGVLVAARRVNEGMFNHAADLIGRALKSQGRKLRGAEVLLLGAAYKAGVAEVRNAPGPRIARTLEDAGATVRIHDPLVPDRPDLHLVRDLETASRGVDCVVLVTAHESYRDLDWRTMAEGMRGRALVDLRGTVPRDLAEAAGLRYYGLGRNTPPR